MKKQLDTTGIANELRGASVFFAQDARQKPVPEPSEKPTPQTAMTPEGFSGKEKPMPAQPLPRRNEATKERTIATPNEATTHRSTERTVARSLARTKVRHTFDVFADQVTSLRRIVLAREEMFDQHYRLGDLVQEALDAFITKQRNNE
jgi:hypothetical protein